MKKITFLILAVFSCSIISAQEANKLDELLERLETYGNAPVKEPANLFTVSERIILQNYFEDFYGLKNTNSILASGDVFGLDLRNDNYGSFPIAGPYNINTLASISNSIFAGDFADDGNLYAIDNDTKTLIQIDKMSGSITTMAPLTNFSTGHNITGMSFNESNHTMYVTSTDATVTTLYTIEASGVMTVVGNTGNSIGIWLAIDKNGNAFMADIGDDNLYSIDLTTAAGTLVGPLGINISFAQGADFDPATGNLYMAAYIGGGVNSFCIVDTTTGTATPLGTINSDNAEVGFMTIEESLGLEESVFADDISLLPNPATDFLTIQNKSNINLHNISIFNLTGKRVKDIKLSENTTHIDISDLSPGVYVVEVIGDTTSTTQKLIIK